MTNERPNGDDGNVNKNSVSKIEPGAEKALRAACIEAGRTGNWMPAEELRVLALAASEEGKDVALNLDGIDHLDASALQILLALEAEQRKMGRHLHVRNASHHLRQWFEYAGATEHFFKTERSGNE